MADGFSHGVLLDNRNTPVAHFHQDEDPDCRYCAEGLRYIPRPAHARTKETPIPDGVDHRHKVLCHWCRMGVADTGTPKVKKGKP